MNTLSFELETTPYQGDEDVPAHLLIEASPVIDGIPFQVGSLDTALILALGAQEYEFDLFTCSCGVAGCAGFFEPVKLTESATQVQWHIPEEPFRARTAATLLPPAGEPIRFTFDKAAYLSTLAKLKASILAIEEQADVPCALGPDNWPDLNLSISSQLERSDEYVAERLASIREDKIRWGFLYDAQVEIEFAGSATYRVWLLSLARQLAHDHPDQEHSIEQLAQLFRANPDAVEGAVRAMDYDTVLAFRWRVSDEQGDEALNVKGWPQARIRLVLSSL